MKTRKAHTRREECLQRRALEARRSIRFRRRAAGAARLGVRSRQRGAGKIKAIIVTAILAFAVYAAVKIVPPYAAEFQLADKIQEQARFAVVNRYTEEQIRNNIFKVVQDLDIPAKREDIKIESSQQVVKIAMDYTVPIDLLAYHLDLHFTPSSENKALY
jgi:hypothetical protein